MSKVEDRIESVATKMVSKMMPKRVVGSELPEQVKVARKLLGMAGLVNFRANLLKDRGLPSDIKDLLKKGMTKEDIKIYYWACPEFKAFWLDIQCTEGMLDEMIRVA